ncbi:MULTISPECIES: hypothetical protein [unclassified Gilliamella]|uniref:hypothetical protein n=1 Tax=unclassified Gilliamella TaxID=2685620 RepID=UPI00159EBC31|nr:hypothetical protein [Gilliamella apicola]
MSYTINDICSVNGTEYKGTIEHDFVKFCQDNKINQKLTKIVHPQLMVKLSE